MNASEYERITSDIANSVFARAEGMYSLAVQIGSKSKWPGQSGFVHQIDVAIEGSTDIIMVECKHWKNHIKAEHLLTFIARIVDIRSVLQKKIHPMMVTSERFQSGCKKLAEFYGIDLEIISSPGNFAFEYKGVRFVGIEPKPVNLQIQTHPANVDLKKS
jgi:Restriction endonuclease